MNLNDHVAVTLTPEGERILFEAVSKNGAIAARHIEICHPLRPDGRRVFCWHELMFYFGQKMYVGNPTPPLEMEVMRL